MPDARVLRQRILSILLMTLGRIALESINQPGLGRAEEEPVISGLLQGDKEPLTAVDHLVVDIVATLEFGLERKLAAQRMVSAPLAPDTDVRIRGDALAEVKYTEVLEHLFDDGLIHEFDPIGVGGLQWLKTGNTRARVAIDVRSPSGAWLRGNCAL